MLRLFSSACGGSWRGCTMMAVRLRYSFRVNSRKVVSSRMGTLCSEAKGCEGLPDLAG